MARQRKTEYAILGLLAIRPMSGYDMKAFMVKSISFFWQESYGQIYPALKRLLEGSYVTRKVGGKKGRSDRHVYSITAKGRKRLETWLASESEPEKLRNELLLKLFFGSSTTPEVQIRQLEHLLRRQLGRLKALKRVEHQTLQEHASSLSYPYWHATMRYGVHVTRAHVAWCRETLNMVEQQEKKRRKEK